MDEGTRSRIFEPFFTTKELGKGTGLGLASVYGTVKLHNGFINVKSEPNKGTEFAMYFPIVNITKPTTAVLDGLGTPNDKKGNLGHILVIDDEHYILEICREILTDCGYSVTTCDNGLDALDYYQRHYKEVDAVIIDMIMPKLTGTECFGQLKKINPLIKAILSTGYSLDEEAKDILRSGILGFIRKPFAGEDLKKIVREVLELK